MTHFRKVWDEEKNNWLIEHKDMNRKEAYELFMSIYPDSEVSFTAFCNQRSRTGAVTVHTSHGSTIARPLYSEHEKKGYIFIKVAQPNVWIPKSKFIYEQSRNVKLQKDDYVVFLDGDIRNFNPENLYLTKKGNIGILNGQFGGLKKGDPEGNLVRIKQAELFRLMMDKARKIDGLCYKSGQLKSHEKAVRMARLEKNRDEYNGKQRTYYRIYIERIKKDPEAYAEYMRKQRIRQKKWYEKKKREKSTI